MSQGVRAGYVESAIHSVEMEGLVISSATRSDINKYIAEEIDSDELVARVLGRYELNKQRGEIA